jgi:uncharacterized protein YydD (DUF2326 family)
MSKETAIAYSHFTLDQWKWIVFSLMQQLLSDDIHTEAKEELRAILRLCPSTAL